MFALAAFLFVSTVLLSFYRLLGSTGDDISSGQDGILGTTISTSYLEMAQGMAFDEITDTSDVAIQNASAMTPSARLGPDNGSENSMETFNDFDDFKGFTVEKEAGGTGRRYRTRFDVNYVSPTNIEQVSSSQTFLKRMDLKTWRTFPPAKQSERLDTLKMSLVMGYFHFD
jgi:hypothetical protein